VKDCIDPSTTGTLTDSKQRASKGFTTTFQFARTLAVVNYAFAERIWDHNPIVVDLPFQEPKHHTDNAATSQNQIVERLDKLPHDCQNGLSPLRPASLS
jgi:hypothetical protein